MTKDLDKRIERHNNGREKTTRFYRPYKLIFSEICQTRKEAREREKNWKSGTGKEQLKNKKKNYNKPWWRNW